MIKTSTNVHLGDVSVAYHRKGAFDHNSGDSLILINMLTRGSVKVCYDYMFTFMEFSCHSHVPNLIDISLHSYYYILHYIMYSILHMFISNSSPTLHVPCFH